MKSLSQGWTLTKEFEGRFFNWKASLDSDTSIFIRGVGIELTTPLFQFSELVTTSKEDIINEVSTANINLDTLRANF